VPNISDAIRRLAEEPDASFGEPPPPSRLIKTAACCIGLSPTLDQSNVTAIHTTAAELDGVIAEARGHLRAAGYVRNVWVVGPSCRPDGLVEMLLARGFFPPHKAPYEPEMTAMALVDAPPPPPPGIEARRVRDYDEYLATMRIAMRMMGESEGDGQGWVDAAPTLWAQENGVARYTHAAFIDGKMIGFAWTAPHPAGLMLAGSFVLPEARGRGAYRALVAARWQTAVALGTPALAIQAGAMSRPILERCGFEALCQLTVLQDPEVK
jgi:GNAT superfamily N-acetyltransferase